MRQSLGEGLKMHVGDVLGIYHGFKNARGIEGVEGVE